MYTIQGEIHKIGATRQSTHDPKLNSRELILKYETGKSTQYLRFLLFNEKCNLPAGANTVGECVSVVFIIKGKEKQQANAGGVFYSNTLQIVSIVPLTPEMLITEPAREKRPRIRREKINYEFKRNSEKQ